MNIYTKIKKDHDEARDMMERILETQDGTARLELFAELKVAILSHAKAEERTFYNALKAANDELAEETPSTEVGVGIVARGVARRGVAGRRGRRSGFELRGVGHWFRPCRATQYLMTLVTRRPSRRS